MVWRTTIAPPVLPSPHTDNKIRVLWVTDNHCTGVANNTQDLQLRRAVARCREWRPTALINTGDMGGNTYPPVAQSFNIMRDCGTTLIATIGNHDEYEPVLGTTNLNEIIGSSAFDRYPLYTYTHLTPPDASWRLLVVSLDCNHYSDPPPSDPTRILESHTDGQRIGYVTGDAQTAGGYWRKFGTAQLTWLTNLLAADNSDAILLLPHYPNNGTTCTDYAALADIVQADGRPCVAWAGHHHNNAYIRTQQSIDTLYTLNIYKAPAILESGCWVEVVLSFDGALNHDQLHVKNFTNPGAWTINLPFVEV